MRTTRALVDISQENIDDKCSAYLKWMQRDQKLIDEYLNQGHCVGYTTLSLYSLLIQLKYHTKVSERSDDWNWLKRTLIRISNWDEQPHSLFGRKKSKRQLRQGLERFVNLIEYLQNSKLYDNSRQMEFQNHFHDTQHRRFYREYSLAGLFTAHDFVKTIQVPEASHTRKTTLLDEIIFEDRMVFLTSNTHIVGLIKHQSLFFFYNASHAPKQHWTIYNNIEMVGWQIFSETETVELTAAIFGALRYDKAAISPIGIVVISEGQTNSQQYIHQSILFDAIYSNCRYQAEDKTNTTGLYVSIDIQCHASFKYYLSYPKPILKYFIDKYFTNSETSKRTALIQLIYQNREEINVVEALLKAGANPNYCDADDDTPLILAVKRKNKILTELLLKYDANPNRVNNKGETALYLATLFEDPAIIEQLLIYQADVNIPNNEGESPLKVAIIQENFACLECLLKSPNLHINKNEYDMLQEFDEDDFEEDITHTLLKTHVIYFKSLIQDQLSVIKNSQPEFYADAIRRLNILRVQADAKTMSVREQILDIYKGMYPLLLRGSNNKSHMQFWKNRNLIEPIHNFVESFGIPKKIFSNQELKCLNI